MTTTATPEVARKASFQRIRYASVWEDADVLCHALGPRAWKGRLLSIASGGDNVLGLLTLDPGEVVAADLSAPQLACLELRKAAFRRLHGGELHAFLGVLPSPYRIATYTGLRGELPESARAFWDVHLEQIRRGVVHAGRFERYLKAFGRGVLRLVHSPETIRDLRRPKSTEARRAFYDRHWDTPRWRMLFRVFFSRTVMGRLGRDPQFFAHVQGEVSDRILERTRHALRELPTHDNPYLAYILTGNFPPEALPLYLRPEHEEAIRSRLDRVRPFHGPVQEAPGEFDGFNLSDLFEYLSPDEHRDVYGALVRKARPHARLAYWNMLVPRGPASDRVRPLDTIAAGLHREDRAWFYSAFHLDEVIR